MELARVARASHAARGHPDIHAPGVQHRVSEPVVSRLVSYTFCQATVYVNLLLRVAPQQGQHGRVEKAPKPLASQEALQVGTLAPWQSLGRLDSCCGSVTWDSHNPRHRLRLEVETLELLQVGALESLQVGTLEPLASHEALQVGTLEPWQSLGRLDSGCGSVTWDSHNPRHRHPLRSSLLWSSRALGSGAGEAAQLLVQRPWLELLAGRAWPSPREVLTSTLAAPGLSMPIVMTTPPSHASNWNLLSQVPLYASHKSLMDAKEA